MAKSQLCVAMLDEVVNCLPGTANELAVTLKRTPCLIRRYLRALHQQRRVYTFDWKQPTSAKGGSPTPVHAAGCAPDVPYERYTALVVDKTPVVIIPVEDPVHAAFFGRCDFTGCTPEVEDKKPTPRPRTYWPDPALIKFTLKKDSDA